MLPDPQAFADVLLVAMKSALAPVKTEQAALADRLAMLEQAAALRDETLTKDVTAMRERLAVMEARPGIPGPPGEPGPPGRDGQDGTPGLSYVGVYQDGKSYAPGDVTTWAGSAWHCHTATTSKPGEGASDWQLIVKRGRDGKDAK